MILGFLSRRQSRVEQRVLEEVSGAEALPVVEQTGFH